ncbi:MAG: UDP-N-acetylglucosamine 2-epimerase (non-hydrolyzing) [Gammaproteobacteria bacterium]|nr:UDP-N-acetylglucosamine 2-epimerase (non-hydrolyzing) [Gammaproteobacteria bacterium]
MLIDIIAGARPNFIKVAPIMHAISRRRREGGLLRPRLIHTGQHYDARMSGDFFEQLGIPSPDFNLEVGSGSHAGQTAGIMVGYERLLQQERSGLCLVVGDVNSTLACAVTAQKCGVPVAHVEGGIRSGDWSMPEEINRLATDAISNWFFTTSEHANSNLRRSGVAESRILFVGNTMIDTLLANLDRLRPPSFAAEVELKQGEYLVLTLHRPANVDAGDHLVRTLSAICHGANGKPVVFPVHPRTSKSLAAAGFLPVNLHLVDPQPYLEFNWLVRHALAVVTDSGGITEETTVLGVPCLTLRDNTERPETIEIGTNELIGTHPERIGPALARVFTGAWKRGGIPPLWDGKAGERIVGHLESLLG